MSDKSIAVRFVTRFKSNPVLANVLAATGNALPNHSWIFIVGCYNSGTTLLEKILSMHPQISGLNEEGVMLTNQLKRPEDFGWRRMWWKCENELQVPEQSAKKIALTVKRQWSHFYDTQKSFLVEKSISNTARMPFLEANFQPAYFIHIVRNGYAVAEGISRKAMVMEGNPYADAKRYPVELCVTQWKRSLQIVEENKHRVKNFMEVRYEDLTENTDVVLERICTFLGAVPFGMSMEEKAVNVHGQKQMINNMNAESMERLLPREIKQIEQVAGDYLRKYNYPPVSV